MGPTRNHWVGIKQSDKCKEALSCLSRFTPTTYAPIKCHSDLSPFRPSFGNGRQKIVLLVAKQMIRENWSILPVPPIGSRITRQPIITVLPDSCRQPTGFPRTEYVQSKCQRNNNQ